MNTQNIFTFYGHRLDVKLDSSEYYDFELEKHNDDDFDESLLDFDTPITYESLIADSSCLNGGMELNTPWIIPIGEPYTTDNCEFTIDPRPERGWTLDFVFNRNNISWQNNSIFFYAGIKDETNPANYLSNNISIGFTSSRTVLLKSLRYTSVCNSENEVITGSTITTTTSPQLCLNGTSSDFNITITFERYFDYEGCELENEGGSNDLITDYTVTNPLNVLSGDTENVDYTIKLNHKWATDINKRLGKVSIYLNGIRISRSPNVEEIIPFARTSENPIVIIFGSGTTGIDNVHNGSCPFIIKSAKYFNEPLNPLQIRHYYLSTISPNFNITEC